MPRAARTARVAVLAAAALCAGCSGVELAYRNADHLVLARLERFVELDPDQRETLGAALERGLERHGRIDLPVLLGRLRETRAGLAGGLDRPGAAWRSPRPHALASAADRRG